MLRVANDRLLRWQRLHSTYKKSMATGWRGKSLLDLLELGSRAIVCNTTTISYARLEASARAIYHPTATTEKVSENVLYKPSPMETPHALCGHSVQGVHWPDNVGQRECRL